ncbi:MAG: hypothetical protein LUE11_00610 [Clostridia bacterium]|nr:hypothetical protein [Clostridia bacterium]
MQAKETEQNQLRQRIHNKQIKLIHDLRVAIVELVPYIDDIETLQVLYAHTLAAFYDEGKPAEDYIKELKGNGLRIYRGTVAGDNRAPAEPD